MNVTENRDSDFENALHGIFTVGILTPTPNRIKSFFSGKDLETLLHGEGRSACISYSQVWKDLVKDIPLNLKDFLLGRKLFEGIRDKTGEYDECARRYYPDWNR